MTFCISKRDTLPNTCVSAVDRKFAILFIFIFQSKFSKWKENNQNLRGILFKKSFLFIYPFHKFAKEKEEEDETNT